ncbi:MAG: hypothetical protein ACRDI0_04320 [Actinomycetota bacterium]
MAEAPSPFSPTAMPRRRRSSMVRATRSWSSCGVGGWRVQDSTNPRRSGGISPSGMARITVFPR